MIERQLQVLAFIPAAPGYVTVAEVVAHLRDAGIRTHKRTVQRDLAALARVMPLRVGRPRRPYAWQWAGPCPCCDRPVDRAAGAAPPVPAEIEASSDSGGRLLPLPRQKERKAKSPRATARQSPSGSSGLIKVG